MIVQIYGLTNAADAAMVASSGADHAGVVLEEGYGTWDAVDATGAAAIVHELRAARTVKVVGLSLSVDVDEILRTIATVQPDIAHVVRITDAWTPEDVARLRERLAPIELMCTIGVRDATAVEQAARFAPSTDWLLLDTAHPATGVVGATGVTHDWEISHRLVDTVEVPVILAGGLGPHNVAGAIGAVRPAGVDSETQTSRADDRRRKDATKVEQFVAIVRGLERAGEG